MKKALLPIIATLLLSLILCAAVGLAEAPAPAYIWTMDTAEEVASFDNDNTGATLSWTNEVVCQGSHALAVTPSGKAAETKVALPFSGDKVQLWQAAKFLVVSFYLAPECELIPNMFFLGLADVTQDWAWVDGIFAKAEVKAGWNQISYPLSPAMRKVDAAHKYKIYLAFAVQDGGNKTPLVDRFYLDGIYGTQE